jgi:transcriptional regulator with XRE-family HTH domain
MDYVSGSAIRALREKKKLTQKQLGELLCVSDKAISKWETGRGLPDSSLLAPLASALGISLAELLSGQVVVNQNRSARMDRTSFYVCPLCGNVIASAGQGSFSCCGITLPPLVVEDAEDAHDLLATIDEDEYHVTMAHPMTREHYLTFFAYVTADRVELVKLYPQQEAQCHFFRRGPGKIYACCNRHGLYVVPVGRRRT